MHMHREKTQSAVFSASSVIAPLTDSRGRSLVDVPTAAGVAWVSRCSCGATRTAISVPGFGSYFLPWKD